MDLQACPRCASLRMRMPNFGEGLVPGGGEGLQQLCPDCGFRGMPLRFQHEADYLAFRASVSDAATVEQPAVAPAEPPVPLPIRSEPDVLDRFRVVPVLAFLAGLVFASIGTLTLLQAPSRTSRSGGLLLYGVPFLLLGIGMMLAAWRIAKRRAA